MSSRLGPILGRNPVALYSWDCDNVFPRLGLGNHFLDFISTLTYHPSLWESGVLFSLLFFSLFSSYIVEFKESSAKVCLHLELRSETCWAFSMCYYSDRIARCQATHTTPQGPWENSQRARKFLCLLSHLREGSRCF